MKLATGASVLYFGVVSPSDDALVATVSGADGVIPGTDAGRAKVSAFADFPAKGRATAGVRAHSFLRGEDRLTVAWVGEQPAYAVGSDGAVRKLPETPAKRDASGQLVDGVIGSIGRPVI